MIRNFRKTSKFEPNFLKNFEIVKKISNGTYLVKNNSTKRYSKINVRDIKRDTGHPVNVDTRYEDLQSDENEDQGTELSDDLETGNLAQSNDTQNTSDVTSEQENDNLELLGHGEDVTRTRSGRVVRPVEKLDL